jgi:hypothetical protein
VRTAICAAARIGYPYTPVEIAGNAIRCSACSRAIARLAR